LKTAEADRIILGIDPGTNIMGYGLIAVKGTSMSLIALGVIHLDKLDDHSLKLKRIFEKTLGLIDEYKPDDLSIEAPFFGKNVQSMLKLGRAQGVAMAAGLYRSVPIFEYSPRKIKQSITGSGNASKEQVSAMLQNLFKFEQVPSHLDATDGLAAAVCHYFQNGKNIAAGAKKETGKGKTLTGWKAFLTENPSRVASK
jgi:crossover junction endodeoxyribonuclease RuvC